MRYKTFIALVSSCRLAITDSGGLQEEMTALGVPCFTVRESTERPETVTLGTNKVVGTNPIDIAQAVLRELETPMTMPPPTPLWDGRAALRIADIVMGKLEAWNGGA